MRGVEAPASTAITNYRVASLELSPLLELMRFLGWRLGLNLVQGLLQGFVGAERFSQGGLEGFVVAAGERNGSIELDGLSGPLLGG